MNIIIMSQTIAIVGLRTKLDSLCREDVNANSTFCTVS